MNFKKNKNPLKIVLPSRHIINPTNEIRSKGIYHKFKRKGIGR